MAAIPGHIKDEVVVIGCHRDGISHISCFESRAEYFVQHGLWVQQIPQVALCLYTRLLKVSDACSRLAGPLFEQVSLLHQTANCSPLTHSPFSQL
jgi:hypothetical protein